MVNRFNSLEKRGYHVLKISVAFTSSLEYIAIFYKSFSVIFHYYITYGQ